MAIVAGFEALVAGILDAPRDGEQFLKAQSDFVKEFYNKIIGRARLVFLNYELRPTQRLP